jgi:hypothetical protein
MLEDASDRERAGAASQIEAMERDGAEFSEIPDKKSMADKTQQYFNNEKGAQGDVSDINRSAIASQHMYERPHAL